MKMKVLLVGPASEQQVRWMRWLEENGYAPMRCPGPSENPCPRLTGMPCSLRERADTAIVELACEDDVEGFDGWSERLCTRLPDDGRTMFILA